MNNSFISFLTEGGKATSQYGTQPANADDVKAVVDTVATFLSTHASAVKIVGSGKSVLAGKKDQCGDVDIIIPFDMINAVHTKMMQFCNGEGSINRGTKIASYAFPIDFKKKVQVDLILSNNPHWSSFIFNSAEGDKSQHKGLIRNILLMNAASTRIQTGKDFIITDGNGYVIARASRSLKLDTGLERLFKIAHIKTDGTLGKTLKKVTPSEMYQFLLFLGKEQTEFDNSSSIIDDPDEVVKFIFGDSYNATDVETAEQVWELIKKNPRKQQIIAKCKADFAKRGMDFPFTE